MTEEYRNRITLLSFVLTVFVIWLHAGESLISAIPGQIAVPGFFLLSGFLFFRGTAEKEKTAVSEPGTFLNTGKAENEMNAADAPGDTASIITGNASEHKGRDNSGNHDTDFPERIAPPWLQKKLRRRIDTLLIPYLCWNFLYFLIYLAAGRAEITEIFEAVFRYSCNPVFWYLFQLLLITAVTPLLYRVMKGKKAAIAWLTVIFLLAVFYGPVHAAFPVQFINEDAFFYYSAGAFIALHIYKEGNTEANKEVKTEIRPEASTEAGPETNTEADLLTGEESGSGPEKPAETAETERRRRLPSEWGKALAAAGALLVFRAAGRILPALLCNVSIIGVRLSGALLLWFLLEKAPVRTADPKTAAAGTGETGESAVQKRGIPVYPWMKITFFIYATHYMIIRLVWAGETALGLNGIAAVNIAVYLLMPAVCTAAAYGLFIIMKKFLPKLLRLLTGGRGMQKEDKACKTEDTGKNR